MARQWYVMTISSNVNRAWKWGLDEYNLLYGSLDKLVASIFWVNLNLLIMVYCANLHASIMRHQINQQLFIEAI